MRPCRAASTSTSITRRRPTTASPSPQFAVNDAFRRAKRLLKDRAKKQRGEVKTLHQRIERTIDQPPDA